MTTSNALDLDGLQHILLDIEGTVSDVRFVYNVMFPFAKKNMNDYLRTNWSLAATEDAVRQVAIDAGFDPETWSSKSGKPEGVLISEVSEHLQQLMATDSKATGLKTLQGLMWKSGFESGALTAELFPDVLPAMQHWKSLGLGISIYSSGSVLAQKLFFGHTTEGDVTPLLTSFFDTTTGKKQEASSYRRIAEALQIEPNKILFLSDVAEELIAASEAGMRVTATVREGNKPLSASYTGARVFAL